MGLVNGVGPVGSVQVLYDWNENFWSEAVASGFRFTTGSPAKY